MKVDRKDGRWYPRAPLVREMVRVPIMAGDIRAEIRYQVHWSYPGIVMRFHDGRWEYEKCPHIHRSARAGIRCGEKVAARWNQAEVQ